MKYFAVLDENNIVTNLIVAESLEIAEEINNTTCIEYPIPVIGDTYANGIYTSPTV
jgi:hypothetical protein